MAKSAWKLFYSVLDPIDRISEVLFGLIMVLTSTGTLSVATAGRADVKTMILAALWLQFGLGYHRRGSLFDGLPRSEFVGLLKLRRFRHTTDPEAGQRTLVDALPAPLVSVLSRDELKSMRQRLLKLPEPRQRARVTKDEWLAALGICLLVFLSTIPVIMPFLFIDELRPALRVSNAIAIVMLFMCGYVFARNTGCDGARWLSREAARGTGLCWSRPGLPSWAPGRTGRRGGLQPASCRQPALDQGADHVALIRRQLASSDGLRTLREAAIILDAKKHTAECRRLVAVVRDLVANQDRAIKNVRRY